MPRQRERCLVELERLVEVAAPVMNFGDAPDGGQVFGRTPEHELEFGLRGTREPNSSVPRKTLVSPIS